MNFGTLAFFSVCNPIMDLGGMLDDKKTDIYDLLPPHIKPQTTVFQTVSDVREFLEDHGLQYPVIVKPNIGFKGYMVLKIDSEDGLLQFLQNADTSEREWLVQQYLTHQHEYSVLFYRYPKTGKYGISSFVEKVLPFVKGDGRSTLKELILTEKNRFIQKQDILSRFSDQLHTVPKADQRITIDVVGNYSRGAKFYSLNHEVSPEFEKQIFDQFGHIEGMNFFRIDLKAHSIENLKAGEFKVIEINGMKSEPLHIYDPSSNFFKNRKVMKEHWEHIKNITTEQSSLLDTVPSFRYGWKAMRAAQKLVK